MRLVTTSLTVEEPRREALDLSREFLRNLLLLGLIGGLFVSGLYLAEQGDGPNNWPSYHAGVLILFSSLITILYNLPFTIFMNLQSAKQSAWFVLWILVGSVGLYLVEVFSLPGDCCENPILRVAINSFTIAWPFGFAGVAALASRRGR